MSSPADPKKPRSRIRPIRLSIIVVLLAALEIAAFVFWDRAVCWWPPEDHLISVDRAGSFLSGEELRMMNLAFPREIPDVPLQPIEFGEDEHRVVMLGLKGSDWRLLAPMVRENRLPNLQRMLAAGAAGNLTNDLNVVDLSVWVSSMTGMPRPEGMRVEWPGPPLWRLVQEAGRRVVPIAHVSFDGRVFGPDRIIERRNEQPITGPPEVMQAIESCNQRIVDQMPKDYRLIACLSADLDYDLFAGIFRSVHNSADEGLYDFADLRMTQEWRPLGGRIEWNKELDRLTDAQIQFDESLGYVMDKMSPGGTLIVCSGRGFRFDGERWIELRFVPEVPGALGIDLYQLGSEPAAVLHSGLGTIYAKDFWAWQKLTWTDQHNQERKVLVRSRGIAITGTPLTMKSWFDSIREKLDNGLGQTADHVEVIRWGPRAAWLLPDEDKLIEAIAISRNEESAEYALNVTINAGGQAPGASGVFLAMGPAIKPGARLDNSAKVEDVTPTILYLMDLPIPGDMQGRVLTEIIEPDVLSKRPVQPE